MDNYPLFFFSLFLFSASLAPRTHSNTHAEQAGSTDKRFTTGELQEGGAPCEPHPVGVRFSHGLCLGQALAADSN